MANCCQAGRNRRREIEIGINKFKVIKNLLGPNLVLTIVAVGGARITLRLVAFSFRVWIVRKWAVSARLGDGTHVRQ